MRMKKLAMTLGAAAVLSFGGGAAVADHQVTVRFHTSGLWNWTYGAYDDFDGNSGSTTEPTPKTFEAAGGDAGKLTHYDVTGGTWTRDATYRSWVDDFRNAPEDPPGLDEAASLQAWKASTSMEIYTFNLWALDNARAAGWGENVFLANADMISLSTGNLPAGWEAVMQDNPWGRQDWGGTGDLAKLMIFRVKAGETDAALSISKTDPDYYVEATIVLDEDDGPPPLIFWVGAGLYDGMSAYQLDEFGAGLQDGQWVMLEDVQVPEPAALGLLGLGGALALRKRRRGIPRAGRRP